MDFPQLPDDQVAIVATLDPRGPVTIPVSALVRAGSRELLLALATRRASLARARADRRAAVSLSGAGYSVCARGRIDVAADPLPGAEFMVALRFSAETVWDARGPATEIDGGIAWHWQSDEAATRHRQVLLALRELAVPRAGG